MNLGDLRSLLNLAPARFSATIFFGAILGSCLLFSWQICEANYLPASKTLHLPEWGFIVVGILTVLVVRFLTQRVFGSRDLPENIVTVLDAIDVAMKRGQLGDAREKRIYEELVTQLVRVFGDETRRTYEQGRTSKRSQNNSNEIADEPQKDSTI